MDSFSEKRVVRKFGSSLKKREMCHACVEFISFENEQVALLL